MSHTSHDYGRWNYHLLFIGDIAVTWSKYLNIFVEYIQSAPPNFCQEHLSTSVLRGHDYKLTKRHCRSHARLSFFSFRVVTSWNNLPSDVRGVCSITKYFQRKTGQILGISLLWIRVCLYEDSKWTANRSLWPNIKGWRKGFKVSRFHFE